MHKQSPPVFLSLLKIRLPVTAVTSILHRISGLLLFLSIPAGIYLLNKSLQGKQDFIVVSGWLGNPVTKVLLTIVLWAFFQHFFAGLRFLLLDIDVGIQRQRARASAWLVNIAALLVTALIVGGCL